MSQHKSVIVDPSRVKPRETERGSEQVWHHELVGQRLIDAAATVRRMPMRIMPKQFGCIWPAFNAMTHDELTALKNELLQTGGVGALAAWERDQNRTRIPPSGKEIERAEEALGWVPRYLGHDKEVCQIVGYWANKTYSLDDDIPGPVRAGLRDISRGLRRDKVPVR
jgi:hypothetical protein